MHGEVILSIRQYAKSLGAKKLQLESHEVISNFSALF